MKNNIRFIYFDIGRVILHYQPSLHKLSEHSGKSMHEVLAVFEKYNLDGCAGTLSSRDLWLKIQKDLHFTHNAPDYASYWSSYLEPIVETHEFISSIVGKYPLGLLTNIEHGVLDHALSKKHIPNISWTIIIESCRVGMMKPNLNIYHLAQQQAGVAHSEILFIDDKEENITAARSLGWQTVHFDPSAIDESLQKVKKALE